jgi:NDP-sugar pyrophosphorylase family protein
MLEEQSKQPITGYKEHHFTPIIQKLIGQGFKLGINLMKRPVLDFGRPINIMKANKVLIDEKYKINADKDKSISKICIGKNSVLIESNIGDYSCIGSNTKLERCSLENVTIGDNCVLKDINLKNAILDDNSTNLNYLDRIIQL